MPFVRSYTGRRTSQPQRTSYACRLRTASSISTPRTARSRSCSSYALPSDSAFWKIDGFVVTPTTCLSLTRSAGLPVRRRSRDRSSSQIETPAADRSASASDTLVLLQLPVVLPDVLPSLDRDACAAATTRSPVRPNCSYRTLYGADAPKCSSDTH